jgi:dihydropteroate synthase
MRILNITTVDEIYHHMKTIGVDTQGIHLMTPKAIHYILKIEDIPLKSALIIKQEMLSRGGDAAISKGAIELDVKTTDMLLIGTKRQYQLLISKLKQQYFGLPALGDKISKALQRFERNTWNIKCKHYQLNISNKRTLIMGILNITPDSFFNGGRYLKYEQAIEQAQKMKEEGADIIDIGGESTRPGAEPVSEDEEKKRILPVIEQINKLDIPISVDTYKSGVADAALNAGACIVNDISGLKFDPEMANVIAKHNAGVILMHIKGTPKDMQNNPQYKDVINEIIEYLQESINIGLQAGISEDNIIIDPGIGFGKTLQHNLKIINYLRELRILGRPILIGTSRKSFIGKVLDLPVEDRLEGTAATVAVSILQGANIIRVHDVKHMYRVARMVDAIKDSSG